MTVFDTAVLAERAMAVERHLRRVGERLPASAAELQPATDASDAVILHLWQATQIVIDLAMGCCLALGLGTPGNYGDAFRLLQKAAVIEVALADRLVRAAGFCNIVAHAYGTLDMVRVHDAATNGPVDLRSFLRCIRDRDHAGVEQTSIRLYECNPANSSPRLASRCGLSASIGSVRCQVARSDGHPDGKFFALSQGLQRRR